ncbi:hypothetical protein [Tuwongella immobilis]|uniref:Uncharacterized protein n=1 Tax=Tuwongella immobilis TaxID=692036 RepID=A0A6C2YKQ7_9BACT|nr:hypothetical protein [Tuwongella immobilis]VIP02160.1 unnamed protein product [Tuwongella immobilis]VIP05593.1 unnamed protein product [Tuwongella immobilis]VTS00567.1 unnamed protein product [Tuwongella immobilis]VTS08541.1 unnamed protein product [Tuwongella immobilis]
MAIEYGLPTTPPEVLAAVETWLVSKAILPAHLIFATVAPIDELEGQPPGDRFVTLAIPKLTAAMGDQIGGGRYPVTMQGELEITAWARLDVDQYLRARNHLQSPLGAWALVGSIATIVQTDFQSLGKSILAEPLRLKSIEAQQTKTRSLHRVRMTLEFGLVLKVAT